MTKDEYKAKIAEIDKQKHSLSSQLYQVNMEFIGSLLRELEEQGITPGTKVLVKTKEWCGGEIDTETYFFGINLVYGKVTHVFHKIKKDGTMSQINQYIGGEIISIHKI